MSSYLWNFSDSYLGKNPDSTSYESLCNLVFKQLNTNTDLNTGNYNGVHRGYQIDQHDDIAYIDLNTVHNPDASFTIEFNVTELDTIDTSRAVNYLTFGYHIRGRSGVALTVGRPANSSNVVLGTITGVFGGVLRDVLCAEIPMILRKGNIYATAAIVGTSAYVVLQDAGVIKLWAAVAGILVIVALRLAAIIWQLSLPVFTLEDRR